MINPIMGYSVTAATEAGGRHLFLEVIYEQAGWVVKVLETDGNTVVAEEKVGGLEEGKRLAEEIASNYLADKNLKLPAINWNGNDKE